MTWEIVLGLISLLGAVGLIGGWISKSSSVLTKLNVTIETLNTTLDDFKESNKESHKEFYDKLADHENRLLVLEIHEEDRKEYPPH